MHINPANLQTSTERSNSNGNGKLSSAQPHRDVASAKQPVVDEQESKTTKHPGKSGVLRLERWLTRRLLASLGSPLVNFVLWNGEEINCSEETPQFTIRLQDRGTLWRLLRDPFFQFGELYSDGRLQIEGDLLEFLRIVDRGIDSDKSVWEGRRRFLRPFRRRPQRNTPSGSKQNIHAHYDLGNDFYKLWLDERLLYTCAYFEEPGISLDAPGAAR